MAGWTNGCLVPNIETLQLCLWIMPSNHILNMDMYVKDGPRKGPLINLRCTPQGWPTFENLYIKIYKIYYMALPYLTTFRFIFALSKNHSTMVIKIKNILFVVNITHISLL